jgi:predicted RNA-binding protein with PUA-like domain
MAAKNRRYWLMKTEPSCFSIDDLKAAPGGMTAWDGVRNYQARNLLRDEIQAGDGVLFYHSNIKDPAIAGIAEVVAPGAPDETAMDPHAEHYDPKAGPDNPIWYKVDVAFRVQLQKPLTRADLRRHPDLADMAVLKKGNRLSVQPVTEKQWRAVIHAGGIKDPLTSL